MVGFCSLNISLLMRFCTLWIFIECFYYRWLIKLFEWLKNWDLFCLQESSLNGHFFRLYVLIEMTMPGMDNEKAKVILLL